MPTCPHPICPCGHKNVAPEALINHVQSSTWAALYFCAACKCVCRSEIALIHHKQKVHKIGFAATPSPPPRASSSATSTCRICERPYATASALEQHYRDTPAHPKCPRCNIGFVDNAAIQTHMDLVHRPAVSMATLGFSCRNCNIAYASKNALEQHYFDNPVHPNCPRCDIGFVDNAAIQAHMVSVHRPIACDACNGLPLYQEDIAYHYRTSANHPSCLVCDIGFENKEALDQHSITRHPGLSCRTCSLLFASADLLNVHYQESPKHPRCPECQLSFEDNLALIKHVIAIFNPLIKDSGRLILKTSQMCVRDAFSDAGAVSPATRSPSVARSVRESWVAGITPTRSVASPVSVIQRQISTSPPAQSPAVASVSDRFNPGRAFSGSPHDTTSNISSPALVSRAPSVSEKVIVLDSFEEREEFKHSPESALPAGTPFSRHSTPLSPAGSNATCSLVAGSETGSPVSSARSIFGKAASITSAISRTRTAGTVSAFGAMSHSASFGSVSPTKESLVETARGRASSILSGSTDTRREGRAGVGSFSPSSIKTVSPPPSHDVSPSPGLSERFSITLSDNPSRADSPPKHRDSERFPSPEPSMHMYLRSPHTTLLRNKEPVRQPSPPSNITKAEPGLAANLLTPPTASPTVGATYPSAQPLPDLAPGEKLVSYIYCRICRRDPCRQPAATMCGHVFCHQCITSEVVKTSRCPVCEAPILLYSIFKLHLV